MTAITTTMFDDREDVIRVRGIKREIFSLYKREIMGGGLMSTTCSRRRHQLKRLSRILEILWRRHGGDELTIEEKMLKAWIMQ